MKEKINLGLFGACGDDCSRCPRYTATLESDKEKLERVKELWIAFGWRSPDVSVEDLKCSGCAAGNKCSYQALRDCAFGKGLDNCGLCPDYPCATANAAFDKTENLFRSFKNLCSEEELNTLEQAFRFKKSNLDRVNKFFSNKK